MGRKRTSPLGQITFKLPPARHEELLTLSSVFHTDISGIINQILAEHLPAWLKKALEVREKQAAARKDFEALTVTFDVPPGSEHLVRLAMAAAGGETSPEGRVAAMVEAIKPHAGGWSPLAVMTVVSVALHQLQQEEERRQVEEAVTRMLEETQAGLDAGDECYMGGEPE